MNNDELYDAALKAIQDLFSDISVSSQTAAENLRSLIGEIEIMLDTLDEA